jgi:hypothetical protein
MLVAQTLIQEVDMHNDELSYIMAMLACDRSFTAARMAGFGLKDTLPLDGNKYFYKISLQGTDIFGEWKVEESKMVYTVGLLQAETANKKVTLSFPTRLFNENFVTYYFERALKRGNFERLHTVPFTVFGNDATQTIFYYDTVEQYDIVYRYRVVGQDVFGTANVVSQEASVKCIASAPNIYDTFEFSHIAVEKDTVPPSSAYLITCYQDSGGVVSLSWKKSASRDVEGYRIFRAYSSSETDLRFGQITSYPISDTFFKDTVSKKVHRKVFYYIKSIDSTGNESKRSNILAAENPLPNFPSSAFINLCELRKDKILLKWFNSPDSDVLGHEILMRKDSGQWEVIADIPLKKNAQDNLDSIFITVKENGNYYFDVRAYTENAETSAPFFATYTLSAAVFIPSFEAIPLRDKFCVVVQWKQSEITEVKKIYIYRRTATTSRRTASDNRAATDTLQQNFTLIKTVLEAELLQHAYNDKNIKIGNAYQYKIQYEFKDGTLSDYSKAVSIEY